MMMMMMMMMQLAVNDGRHVSRDVVELCSCHVRVCVGAIVPARRLVVHLGLPVSRVAGVVGGPAGPNGIRDCRCAARRRERTTA